MSLVKGFFQIIIQNDDCKKMDEQNPNSYTPL